MNVHKLWPADPDPFRQKVKSIFRALPFRGLLAFIHSYLWKFGVLDGRAGFDLARGRMAYYRVVQRYTKALEAELNAPPERPV